MQATESTLRAGLQRVVRMVMAQKQVPEALLHPLAQVVGGDAEAIQATVSGALGQLANGEISPELGSLLSELSERLAVPESDLRQWFLRLGQGEISDEMWKLLRQRMTDLQPFLTALNSE